MGRLWKLVAATLVFGLGVHSAAQQPVSTEPDKVVQRVTFVMKGGIVHKGGAGLKGPGSIE